MVLDFGVVLGNLMTQVTTLTTTAATSANTSSQVSKLAVARPKAWNGKGGSIDAQYFLAAFFNYAHNEGEILNDFDPNNNCWIQNHVKWIAAVFNLMEDEACTWALPHLEQLSTGGSLFRGDYNQFVLAFNKHFAPLDSAEAV